MIRWVNHASFIIETKNIKLISDPWIEGRVFNESWELVSKTKFEYDDFRNITHIWFSHEHPDHFFPPNLKKIKPEHRSKITVLFQQTEDKKVVNFCEKLGFQKVIELDEFKSYRLAPGFSITNGKVKNDTDSWLHVKTDEISLLNINDCVLSEPELQELQKYVGSLDILLSQFSFANWPGNPEDKEAISSAAQKKLKQLIHQVDTFQPRYTIPFASYVWFCHKDNYHFNQYANRIEDVHELLKNSKTTPIVLYPGDAWANHDEKSSTESIEKYIMDRESITERSLTEFSTVKLEDLAKSADAYLKRCLAKNNKAKLNGMKPFYAYLTDLNKSIRFSFKEGLVIDELSQEECDISFHSQSLNYCFNFEWGFDTIQVAGTFTKPKGGEFQNFYEFQWVSTLNNQGKKLGNIFERAWNKLKYHKFNPMALVKSS